MVFLDWGVNLSPYNFIVHSTLLFKKTKLIYMTILNKTREINRGYHRE